MSARSKIVKALAVKLNAIDGTSPYNLNIFNNAYPKLKFFDEVNDFPSCYLVAGQESRDYQPGGFKWGFLSVSIKAYVKSDTSLEDLELLLEDIEYVIDNNQAMIYDTTSGDCTTEILISSIVTDEGLLDPYGVGEINLVVRYQVL